MELRAQREGVERGRWWGQAGVPAEIPPRRFHLLGVGLPKTGTTSLAGVFRGYRWGHELLFAESIEAIAAWRAGALDDAGMAAWVAARDEAGQLEVDSASFNHFVLALLVERHPTARFVYTRRDPVAWADSFLNMMLRNAARFAPSPAAPEGRPWPAWQVSLGRLLAPSFEPAAFASPEALAPALPSLADELLAFHERETARIEALLPPDRTLVLATDDLTGSLAALADLAGVPLATLDAAGAHENRGEEKQGFTDLLAQRRAGRRA